VPYGLDYTERVPLACSWIPENGSPCRRPGARPRNVRDAPVILCAQHRTALDHWRHQVIYAVMEQEEWAAREARARREMVDTKAQVASLEVELLMLRTARDELWEERSAFDERAPVVYVLQRADGLIKIGTTVQLRQRMQTLMKMYGPLEVLAVLQGSYVEEHALHARFADHLAEAREWFHPHPDIIDWALSTEAAA
jgi:hypothetical protein